MKRCLLFLLLLSACPVKRDHGLGTCTDYKPMCLSGSTLCETDTRGCEICTCAQGMAPPLKPR